MNPKLWAITVSMFLLFSNIALAIPGVPHQFYGAVTVNGASAPDGTTVSARINGIEVASTTTSGGKYGYDGFFVDDPNSVRAGSEIKFFVNDVDTGVTVTFCNGCFNECGTENLGCATLDLSVTIESSSGTTTNGGSGSVGGSATVIDNTGSSTSTGSSTTTQEETVCQEKWTCSDWGECVDGVQTRVCADENQCGTNSREPFSSQPCTTAINAETSTTSQSPIGFFLLSSNEMLIATVVGIVAIVAIFLFLRMRKQKSIVHAVNMNQIKQQLDQIE